MTRPCIICVAITGSIPRKSDNPAVPITVAEQVESTHEAHEAGAGKARGGMLPLKPDMASLSVGSNNFPTRVHENPPDLVDWLASEMLAHDIKPEIECFDLSHIHQAAAMQADGRLKAPACVQFVMGVKNAMPADRDVFDYYIRTVHRLLSGSEWCAAGIGATLQEPALSGEHDQSRHSDHDDGERREEWLCGGRGAGGAGPEDYVPHLTDVVARANGVE